MDNGTLALILSPVAIILTGFITQFVTRRNHQDDTDISSFQANLDAYKGRAEAAESRMAVLEAKDIEKEQRISSLEDAQRAQARQITRMRNVVRDWFKQLKAAWTGDNPMPIPSDEDLELLGINKNE